MHFMEAYTIKCSFLFPSARTSLVSFAFRGAGAGRTQRFSAITQFTPIAMHVRNSANCMKRLMGRILNLEVYIRCGLRLHWPTGSANGCMEEAPRSNVCSNEEIKVPFDAEHSKPIQFARTRERESLRHSAKTF